MARFKQSIRWSLLIIVYLLFFSYALAFTNATGWTLLAFSTLIVIVEVLSLFNKLSNIKVSNHQTIHTRVNEYTIVALNIRTTKFAGIFPKLSISLTKLNNEATLLFYTGRPKTVELIWRPKRRGVISRQYINVTSSDLFNWFEKYKDIRLKADWIVLPKIHELNDNISDFIKSFDNPQSFGESSFDIKKFRSYEPGDSLKHIDWKVSSRKQELIYREYQHYEVSEQVYIFYGINSSYFEDMLSLFYSIYLNKPKNIQLILMGEGVEDYENICLEDFANIRPLNQDSNFPTFTQKQAIIFTPEVNDALMHYTQELSKTMNTLVFDYLEMTNILKGGIRNDKN